jgi:predicted amidohydrolase YtcJ
MRVYEGTVITCDDTGSVARYLVEDRGKIAYVGNELPERYASGERVSLGSGALCPAFADTHIHFLSNAIFTGGLDVRSARDVAAVKGQVARYAAASKDRIVLGFGASPHAVAERRLVTKADLDEAAPDKPVYLVKYDGHAAVANTALLDTLPESVRSQRGYDGDTGLLTQEAFFRATDRVTGTVSLPATVGMMLRAADAMAARGIGIVHSVSGVGFPGDIDVTLESLFARGLRNEIAYRVFFQTLEAKKAVARRLPRIGGCFATALDGCFGSLDAALYDPYEGTDSRGILYYDDERVFRFAREANRAGLQIEMHAIGDRAFDQAVSAIERALEDFPRADHRHTIIHACLPTERGLETCARLGIAFAVQPAFLQWDQEPLSYLETVMGGRVRKLSPLKTMRDLGIVMAGGSDGPCTVPDPIAGIHAACNHGDPAQCLSAQESLDLFTRNAAWLCFDEGERGSLEPGKRADFARLDRNVLAVPKETIRETKVLGLTLGGKPYAPGEGSLELFARALFSRRKI